MIRERRFREYAVRSLQTKADVEKTQTANKYSVPRAHQPNRFKWFAKFAMLIADKANNNPRQNELLNLSKWFNWLPWPCHFTQNFSLTSCESSPTNSLEPSHSQQINYNHFRMDPFFSSIFQSSAHFAAPGQIHTNTSSFCEIKLAHHDLMKWMGAYGPEHIKVKLHSPQTHCTPENTCAAQRIHVDVLF